MLEVDKLLNVSLSVFRDLRNNSLDIKSFPVDIFTGLKNLREMWVLLTTRVSFAWKLGVALYYLVPRFPTASFDLDSRLGATISECVVPENIYSSPSPSHGWKQRKFREEGGGGSKMRQLPRGWGGFPGAPSKIDELFKTNSCPVEEAISHFPVNSLLKQ